MLIVPRPKKHRFQMAQSSRSMNTTRVLFRNTVLAAMDGRRNSLECVSATHDTGAVIQAVRTRVDPMAGSESYPLSPTSSTGEASGEVPGNSRGHIGVRGDASREDHV